MVPVATAAPSSSSNAKRPTSQPSPQESSSATSKQSLATGVGAGVSVGDAVGADAFVPSNRRGAGQPRAQTARASSSPASSDSQRCRSSRQNGDAPGAAAAAAAASASSHAKAAIAVPRAEWGSIGANFVSLFEVNIGAKGASRAAVFVLARASSRRSRQAPPARAVRHRQRNLASPAAVRRCASFIATSRRCAAPASSPTDRIGIQKWHLPQRSSTRPT